MKKFLVLLVLALAGCSQSMANKPIDNLMDWTGFVAPKDQVPAECTQAPPAAPKAPDAGASAKESARYARAMVLHSRKVTRRYKRCQTWAKGQR